jgi:AmmeMemoRadiSam system protein A
MLPLTEADQITLLRMAREAVEECLGHPRLAEIPELAEALRQPCGAFVTLRKGKRLRGCIGYVEAVRPLHSTVRECAVAAALHDPRFPAVTSQEIPELSLEISVLSPLTEIAPEKIEIGRHGLLISRGAQRGLLLPQVAMEWNWNREQFLEETCLKAGLPPDAWQHGARIQAFTAQVFEETGPAPAAHPAA